MEKLLLLYKEWCGCEASDCTLLPKAGSNRSYYRLSGAEGKAVIGCIGTSAEENRAFIGMARHFFAKGLPVPEVLSVSDDGMAYLQEDLGSTSLFDAVAEGRQGGGEYSPQEEELLAKAIEQLPAMQFEGIKGLDFSLCYPQPAFDGMGIMFDLNYFKYCFLKPTGIDFNEVSLEHDFIRLRDDLMSEPFCSFMYRDFQARNIMLTPQKASPLTFIDFQGGRCGPFYYDLASFLWQASAHYPDALKQRLLDRYYAAAQPFAVLPPREVFDNRLQLFVLFRLIQVLGAYGFRGFFERKPHFLNSIKPALASIKALLDSRHFGYDYLEKMLLSLPDPSASSMPAHSNLVVRVMSFSYKRGLPADESGNGGGYVFDCRSTHNPGRYQPYKKLTGLDAPVIEFLEDDGEILTFLDSVYALADAHVERYLQRGFTDLIFAFGCTGGQHRSVYSAEHLANHLSKKFGVEVWLCHRELGKKRVIPQMSPTCFSKH